MPFLPDDVEGYQDGLNVLSEAIKRLSSIDLMLALRLVLYLLQRGYQLDEETKQAIKDIRDVLGRIWHPESDVTIKEYLRRIYYAIEVLVENAIPNNPEGATGLVLSAINAIKGLAEETNFGTVPLKDPMPEGFATDELWYAYGLVSTAGVWRYTYYDATENANNSGYWFRLLPEWSTFHIHVVWPRGRLPTGQYAIETRRVFTNGSEDSTPTHTIPLEYVESDQLAYGYSFQNTIGPAPFAGSNVQYALGRFRFIPMPGIPAGQTPLTLIGQTEQTNPGVIYLTPVQVP